MNPAGYVFTAGSSGYIFYAIFKVSIKCDVCIIKFTLSGFSDTNDGSDVDLLT